MKNKLAYFLIYNFYLYNPLTRALKYMLAFF